MHRIAEDLIGEINSSSYVGVGSGRTLLDLIEELSTLDVNRSIWFVPSSSQIMLKMEEKEFATKMFPGQDSIQLYIDSLDQIEEESYHIIKGGGGALLREKILMYSSEKVVILAQEKKFAERLGVCCPVPVEVSPFARWPVIKYLESLGGNPTIRKDSRGFPVFTENGNLVLDVYFDRIADAKSLEIEVKAQPGVIEVGLFTRKPSLIYRIRTDSFEKLV
jgi:ribose 5-phosphate isomerase A